MSRGPVLFAAGGGGWMALMSGAAGWATGGHRPCLGPRAPSSQAEQRHLGSGSKVRKEEGQEGQKETDWQRNNLSFFIIIIIIVIILPQLLCVLPHLACFVFNKKKKLAGCVVHSAGCVCNPSTQEGLHSAEITGTHHHTWLGPRL